jgi:integrase
MAIKRIRVNGRKVWQARVAYRGLRKSTIRPSKAEARDAEAELLRELNARATATESAGQRPATLRQLFESYAAGLEARGKRPDTIARAVETAHVVEWLLPEWLDQPVSRIGDAEIFAFRQARVDQSVRALQLADTARRLRAQGDRARADMKERAARTAQRTPTKPSTINRDLRTLRAMLKRAVPGFRFPRDAFFKEDETRVRWLRPEEELLVLEPMRSPFREMAKLAALTLMRLSEIRLLRRESVRLEQGVVLLQQTKTEPRAVVLSADAQKLLRGQLEAHPDSDWIFPSSAGRPYERSYVGRVFRRASCGAGLRDFHFHDLRHHGATMALNAGFSAPIVMALGGWKTERMMRRYAAVTDGTLRAAAEAVSGYQPATARAAAPLRT